MKLSHVILPAILFAAVPPYIPEALAFPYKRQVGDLTVRAEQPIPDAIVPVAARAERLRHASAIDEPGFGKRVFLTDGGWRWRWLTLTSSGAFGLTRALSGAIVINKSDITHDRVFDGQAVGGTRSLSSVLAHEQTHGLIRARYGPLADARYPAWLREGYCDVVAGGGSLGDGEAEALLRAGTAHPAVMYWRGRRRAAAFLRAHHGSVDALFASAAAW